MDIRDGKTAMRKRFYYLKHLCEINHIALTYEDPETEAGYTEAGDDLEKALVRKGLIRVSPENGQIVVFGGAKNDRRKNARRRKDGADQKILSVHGQVYVSRTVRGR